MNRTDISDRKRIIRISREQLAAALGLPAGATVDAVSEQLYFDSNDIAVRVCSPTFDRVPLFHAIPVDRYVNAAPPVLTMPPTLTDEQVDDLQSMIESDVKAGKVVVLPNPWFAADIRRSFVPEVADAILADAPAVVEGSP